MENEFRIQMAPVGPIHNIQLADDGYTLVSHVGTGKNQEGVILFRTTVYESKREIYCRLRPPTRRPGP
jgi:hypothetical protein